MSSRPPVDKPKPQLRKWYNEDAARAVAEALSKKLNNPEGSYRSCLNCAAFDEPSEQCRKYGGRPPARVIAYSCGGYEDTGEIPF